MIFSSYFYLVPPTISAIETIPPSLGTTISNGYSPLVVAANIYNFPRLTGSCRWHIRKNSFRGSTSALANNNNVFRRNITVSVILKEENLISSFLSDYEPLYDESNELRLECFGYTPYVSIRDRVTANEQLKFTAKGTVRKRARKERKNSKFVCLYACMYLFFTSKSKKRCKKHEKRYNMRREKYVYHSQYYQPQIRSQVCTTI